jgi:hypothetical protein
MKSLSMHSILIPLDHPRFFRDDPPDLAAQIQAVLPGYARLPTDVIEDDVLLIQDKLPLNPTHRLVVLVPCGEIDETALARRVWQLAGSSGFSVLYLALSPDVTQTAYQRRRLAGLAALTSGRDIHAHASVREEKNWRQALERTLQHGDLLVCLASHKVPEHLFWRRKLGEQLVETAGVPVYMFSGFKIVPVPQEWRAVREVLAWIGSLFLLAAFFGVQVSIDRAIDGPLATILLWISVGLEIYLLWKFNELIG